LSLQEVKDQLLQKPKIALNTAAQTLENCQQNLQSLQTTLQQGLAEGRSTLEKHLSTLGEPGSPSSTANPLAALLSLQRVGSSGALQPAGMEDQATSADGMLPWSLLPAPMRGREAAAIEALVTEDEQEGEDAEASTSGRAWGPFQVSQTEVIVCPSGHLPAWLALAAAGSFQPAFEQLHVVCLLQQQLPDTPPPPASAPHRPPFLFPACSGTRGGARRARILKSRAAACGRMGARC
jgi:hypothetical protein